MKANQPMSPLRRAMIQAIEDRHFAPSTCKTYVHWVGQLARYYGRCPSRIGDGETNAYLLHLIREKKLAWSSVNQALAGIRFLYKVVLQREVSALGIPPRKREQRLPEILTVAEVRRLLEAHPDPRYRTMLHVIYGCGLRVSECARLRTTDIDPEQMRVRVRQGKGKKDRFTLLPHKTLEELRAHCRRLPLDRGALLFPGARPDTPISVMSIQRAYHIARKNAGIAKEGGVHTLRHCFATHHLQVGTDLPTLQRMLGHTSLKTTARYLHVVIDPGQRIRNPLDDL